MIHLDPEKIPEALRYLIPLAEKWGNSDDGYREQMINDASIEELKELIAAVSQADEDLFDDWLGGPQSKLIMHTPEYRALSSIRLAYESAQASYYARTEKSSDK